MEMYRDPDHARFRRGEVRVLKAEAGIRSGMRLKQ